MHKNRIMVNGHFCCSLCSMDGPRIFWRRFSAADFLAATPSILTVNDFIAHIKEPSRPRERKSPDASTGAVSLGLFCIRIFCIEQVFGAATATTAGNLHHDFNVRGLRRTVSRGLNGISLQSLNDMGFRLRQRRDFNVNTS